MEILILVGLAFAFYIIFLNACGVFSYVVWHKHSSPIPFIGGLMGMSLFGISPISWGLRDWWWTPLVLDVTFWGFVIFLAQYSMGTLKTWIGRVRKASQGPGSE